jgi:PD-(D/E)XK nuclease superfamily
VDNEITRALLLAEHCWFRVDVVPGQPDITAYKRRARLQQARWRQMRQLPVGGQLQRDGSRAPVGSRLDLAHAEATAANFLSSRITAAVHHRVAHPEAHQTLNMERLWSDLLSSMPMCFNLLGELWGDSERATAAMSGWFPDVPGRVGELRFEWSPGRLDPSYLGNRSAFDAVLLLDLPGGTKGVLGLETKYHEHAQVEARPRPDRLHRYREVTERRACSNLVGKSQLTPMRTGCRWSPARPSAWPPRALELAPMANVDFHAANRTPMVVVSLRSSLLLHPVAGNGSDSGRLAGRTGRSLTAWRSRRR